MRIAFIVPRFSPETGGVEKHVDFVSRELVSQKQQVIIITSTSNNKLKRFEIKNKILIYRYFASKFYVPRVNLFLNLVGEWLFYSQKIPLLLNCDVIHLHDIESFIWLFPLIPLLKGCRKKIFITFHGFEGRYPVSTSFRILRKIAEKVLNGNICVGSFIINWYGTKADSITIGGVTPVQKFSSIRNKEGAIFVGRLAKDTGIMQYIETIRVLKKKYSKNFHLCICGDGPLRSEIEEFAKFNHLDVYFSGFVENSEKLFQKYRYAFVSGYLAILEAMSNKTLVFAVYDNPLKRDYLYSIPNAKNLLIIASSPNELADKLYAVSSNFEQTEKLLELAYSFASKLTWANLAKMYLQLYEKKGVLAT